MQVEQAKDRFSPGASIRNLGYVTLHGKGNFAEVVKGTTYFKMGEVILNYLLGQSNHMSPLTENENVFWML